MHENKMLKVNLQMFNEGAASGGEGDGATAQGTESALPKVDKSGSNRRKSGALSNVVYGIQEDAPGTESTLPAAEGAEGNSKSGVITTSDSKEARQKAFDELINVHYIGKVKWNWRKTVKTVKDGDVIKSRPKANIDEYLIYEGRHPAIIDDATFKAAAERLGKNPKTPARRELTNPFAGIIFCECGKAMVMRKYTNKGKEKASPRLLCIDQAHCGSGSCLASEITEEVKGALRECISNFELRISGDNKEIRELHNNLIKNLENRLVELDKKEVSLWDKYTEEGMPKAVFDKLNADLLKEKDEVNNGLCEAHASMPEPVDYEKKLYLFKDALEKLDDENTSATEKNQLLKACIERITYKKARPQRKNKKHGWTHPQLEIDVQLRV